MDKQGLEELISLAKHMHIKSVEEVLYYAGSVVVGAYNDRCRGESGEPDVSPFNPEFRM